MSLADAKNDDGSPVDWTKPWHLVGCDKCGRPLDQKRTPHRHPDPAETKRQWLEDEARMFGYENWADMDANFVADPSKPKNQHLAQHDE